MDVSRFFPRKVVLSMALGSALLIWPLATWAMTAPRYAEQTRTTPPTAFLHHKAFSTARLIEQLKADPGARKGYAKLFHISPDQVVPFIESHCTATSLSETGKFTVYRVTTQGTIYPTLQRVPRGSSVFAINLGEGDIPRYISTMGDPMKPFATAVSVRIIRKPAATKVITQVSPSEETLVPTKPVQTVVPASSAVYAAPAPQRVSSGSPQTAAPSNEVPK